MDFAIEMAIGNFSMMDSSWPPQELEELNECPLCGCPHRQILYDNLVDLDLGIAPGKWSLYQCAGCRLAYLDPRPKREFILKAYADYTTHDSEDPQIVRRLGAVKTYLHDAVNGYLNSKYNLAVAPQAAFGRWLIPFLPSLRSAADAHVRHLPMPKQQGQRLLDIGCGNGGFLILANKMGWKSKGLDFDPAAVAVAQQRGVDAQCGGVDLFSDEREQYDVITISHVLEHLHDPKDMLRSIWRLLKPGGLLWLETPNVGSYGHRRFGRYWRGLEPPRHLVLFDSTSLVRLLSELGFHSVRQEWHGLSGANLFAASERIRSGAESGKSNAGARLMGLYCEILDMLSPRQRAFLTYVARK